MKLRFFGTDGIRGEYGSERLNDTVAFRAGCAAARVAKELLEERHPLVAVGRDTRASGEALQAAFSRGVLRQGGRLIDVGVAPTPAISFAAQSTPAVLGCAITASHNPARDNGIKFFQGDGSKPSVELELALDQAIATSSAEDDGSDVDASLIEKGSSLRDSYCRELAKCLGPDALKGMRIALDCANGAMHSLAPQVFRALGAEVDLVGNCPDGTNINHGVGSEHPESILTLYRNGSYDAGFAFDGDGDRVILFDERGHRFLGEATLAALAIDAKSQGRLIADTLVTTVQSNFGLDAILGERGIKVERTDVGDKHIARLMRSTGYSFGGEESGHIVMREFALSGDGLYAAVRLAELARREGGFAAELFSCYRAFPEASCDIRVAAKPPLEQCQALQERMRELESSLGQAGRLLVRYSGTEPKLRLLVEARTEETATMALQALREAAERDLAVVA